MLPLKHPHVLQSILMVTDQGIELGSALISFTFSSLALSPKVSNLMLQSPMLTSCIRVHPLEAFMLLMKFLIELKHYTIR